MPVRGNVHPSAKLLQLALCFFNLGARIRFDLVFGGLVHMSGLQV